MTSGTNAVDALSKGGNAFGLARILLALAVVLSHAWTVGGFGDEPLHALSGGTTTWTLAQHLVGVAGLTVVTNSVPVADAFYRSGRSDQTVILTGGIRTPSDALVGAFAVAMPTRRPVNSPGPTSTAIADTSASSTCACAQVNWIDGARVSAWRLPPVTSAAPSTPWLSASAHPTRPVADSMPRISTASRRGPRGPAPRRRPSGRRSP